MGRWQLRKQLTEGQIPRKRQSRDIPKARRLRKEMSLPEVLLWARLRRQPSGIKFRRQHSIDNYVIDFFVADLQLAIEIDGKADEMGNRPVRDAQRDLELTRYGIETIRIAASDILRSPDEVAQTLVTYCRSK